MSPASMARASSMQVSSKDETQTSPQCGEIQAASAEEVATFLNSHWEFIIND